jgi:hypothetical protein
VNKKGRNDWTAEEKKRIAALEDGPGVTLVGLLFDAKLSEKEACNCFRDEPEFRDFHVWLVRGKQQAAKPKSVVVEMTPPVRSGMAGWDLKKLRDRIPPKAWTRVRVRGYLFFDSEHWDFPNRKPQPVRASSWEIHPVTAFEVCPPQTTCPADGEQGWVKLEKLDAQ